MEVREALPECQQGTQADLALRHIQAARAHLQLPIQVTVEATQPSRLGPVGSMG